MTAPSPAPWTAHGFAVYSGDTYVAQVPVAEFSDDPYVREHALPEAEAKLNLRLIRMAPELWDVLCRAVQDIDAGWGDRAVEVFPWFADADAIRSAITAEED